MNQHPNEFIIRAIVDRGIDHPELLDLQDIQRLCEYLSTLIGEPIEEARALPALRIVESR